MLRFKLLALVTLIGLFSPSIVLANSHDPKRIMPAEVIEKLSAGEEILFLDTRTTNDWATGILKIPNAIHVNSNEVLNNALKAIPKNRWIITYCT